MIIDVFVCNKMRMTYFG